MDGRAPRHHLFEGSRTVPCEAREFVRDALAGAPDEGIALAELLTSELVTSAVRRGSPRVAVAVQPVRDIVRIDVTELTAAVDPTAPGQVDPDEADAFGSRIVNVLASRHGREMRSDGMASWVEIDLSRPTIPWGKIG